MSQTFMEKLNILFNSTLNSLVDKALQRNPIQTLNQYLRDHENAFDEMEDNLILANSNVRTAKRTADEYAELVAKINDEIKAVLTDSDPSNDYVAQTLAGNLVGKEDLLVQANRTHEAAQRTLSALMTANNKLQMRIDSLKNQIELLKAIQSEADIKGMTADILIRSARMVSSGATSVDGLAESIKQNRDKADAKFEFALSKISETGTDTVIQSRADAKLAEIRTRLGLKTDEVTSESPSLDMSVEDLKTLTVNQ